MADKEMYSLANSYPEMQGNPMDVKDHPDTNIPNPDMLRAMSTLRGEMNDSSMKDTLQNSDMFNADFISKKFRK